jgi:hypothetical protein
VCRPLFPAHHLSSSFNKKQQTALYLQVPAFQNTGINIVNSADPSARQDSTPVTTPAATQAATPVLQVALNCSSCSLATPPHIHPTKNKCLLVHVDKAQEPLNACRPIYTVHIMANSKFLHPQLCQFGSYIGILRNMHASCPL